MSTSTHQYPAVVKTSNDAMTPLRAIVRRVVRFPLTRIVIAIFVVALAGGLTLTYLGKLAHAWGGRMWPEICAAAATLLAYGMYVRVFEQRCAVEISVRRAWPELAAGLTLGATLVGAVVAVATAIGAYRIEGMNAWSIGILAPLAMMCFVGVLEEVISRAIVFRVTEERLGTWWALAISSALFGLAHVPGAAVTVLAITITIIAGVLFAAAYLVTRRVWLAIGIHTAWNFTLGSIFSVAVSGRAARGLVIGKTFGPVRLTGGAYGFEGSVITLVVLGVTAIVLLRMAFSSGHFRSRQRGSAS